MLFALGESGQEMVESADQLADLVVACHRQGGRQSPGGCFLGQLTQDAHRIKKRRQLAAQQPPGKSADETAQVAKSAQSGTSAGVGTPDTNPATGTAADTQVLAASVTNQSTSTSDLPWLMYALVAFLAVLIVASILRARVLIRKGK